VNWLAKARMAFILASNVAVTSTTKVGAISVVSVIVTAYASLRGRNAPPRSGR
jgi:hypothetical protein